MTTKYVFNPFTGNLDITEVDAAPVPFTFSSGTLLLQQVLAGQVVERCSILITTVFDDPAATVALGTTASPNLLFGPSDVTLTILGNTYDQAALFKFPINDFLQLIITPGTSTQGAGLLLYKVRK